MRCAWDSLLMILPDWMRSDVSLYGTDSAQEIRMRCNAPPEIVTARNSIWLKRNITQEDIRFTVNTACRYSPWTSSFSEKGYITAHGGHRIGICGQAVVRNGDIKAFQSYDSLCIRVARDVMINENLPDDNKGSVLILGAPGWGKTTLLRNLSRNIAMHRKVVVIDERGELFPDGFARGKRMDVLHDCPKKIGIDQVLRTMGPDYIAVDEITCDEDCAAMREAVGSGVSFLATAHAGTLSDLARRPVYRKLIEDDIFDVFLVLRQDQSFTEEGKNVWGRSMSVRS